MSGSKKKSMSVSLTIPKEVKGKAGIWAGSSENHQHLTKCTTPNFWKARSFFTGHPGTSQLLQEGGLPSPLPQKG